MARKAAKKSSSRKTGSNRTATARKKPQTASSKRAAATKTKGEIRKPTEVEVLRVPKSGKWILKEKGEENARASFDQKEDAVAAAKVLAKAEKVNVKIKGR